MSAIGSIGRASAPALRWRLVSILYFLILCCSTFCNAFSLTDTGLHHRNVGFPSNGDVSVDLPHLHSPVEQRGPTDQRLVERDASSSATATATSTSSAAAATSSAPIPRPFDTSLGNNFTQTSCPIFFNSFLQDPTFQSCVPFSLLLQNSKGWFQIATSNASLTPILDDSCNAPFQTCAPLMSSLAGKLISNVNCAADYSLGNPLVVQAYRGLLSYAPMYKAACLKADSTGKTTGNNFPYCYTSALNSSSGADSMLYFMPLGLGLSGGSSISCSSCTQQTMQIYASAAMDSNSPLNKEYLPAANMMNTACGAGFVNASTSIVKSSSTSAPSAACHATVSRGLLAISVAIAMTAMIML